MTYWKRDCTKWGKKHNRNFYEMLKKYKIVLCGKSNFSKGDIVALCEGFTVVAIAVLTSERFSVTDADINEDIPELEDVFDEYEIDYEDWNYMALAKIYEIPKAKQFRYPLRQGGSRIWQNDIIKKLNAIYKGVLKNMEIKKIANLLLQKKNIILQGAPGVGKTYATASVALSIIDKNFGDFDDHKKVMAEYKKYVDGGQIQFVTFHQSYDYEDFVEGIKPETDGDKISYPVESGIFKKICEIASNNFDEIYKEFCNTVEKYTTENNKLFEIDEGNKFALSLNGEGNLNLFTGEDFNPNGSITKEMIIKAINQKFKSGGRATYYNGLANYLKNHYELKNFVLIIDEINRGNVSKIFGELITLLESDKRTGAEHEIFVTLPYSCEDFSVPPNLYIIGTMNTTDRSVGNIDYAVRRRFAFVTLNADKSVIENYYKDENLKNKATKLFDAVRAFLDEHKCDMNIDDLMVGHSYFLANDVDELRLKLDYEIIPLVREYAKDGIILCDDKTLASEIEKWKAILI